MKKKTTTKTNTKMIDTLRKRCNKLNVKLILRKGFHCKAPDGFLCDGYFDPPHLGLYGELVVATKRPNRDWQYTLLHEYAHMMQWFHDDPIFDSADYYSLEKQTERQALKLSREFGLDIAVCKKESRNYLQFIKNC